MFFFLDFLIHICSANSEYLVHGQTLKELIVTKYYIEKKSCLSSYAVVSYGKCSKILNTSCHTFLPKFCFLCINFINMWWNGNQCKPSGAV